MAVTARNRLDCRSVDSSSHTCVQDSKSNCKAQTSTSGCPVARATGASLNSLIKEDHLLACTTRMFECALFTRQACKYDDLDLSRPPGTPRLLNTHPRGVRLFT